jgi:predicted ester cyclase
MRRAFENKNILKGIICHGMWLMSPIIEVVKGRKAVVHNNLLGDAKNYGLEYINEDVIVDGDKVVIRVELNGVHEHEAYGLPATGNKIQIESIEIFRFNEEGKIVEMWVAADVLGLLTQMGMKIPDPFVF